ncbi:hypothetical protein [Prauserella marina]|uniref:hypothetical protein n=1 Tax=Prauserella marina TaxID=530584 RepID=UPI00115FB1E4|nr:hypothetical protein [Prauserella marina]
MHPVLTGAALAVVAGALLACSPAEPETWQHGPPTVPGAWLERLNAAIDNADQVGPTTVIQRDDECTLLEPPIVGDARSRSFGAGVSTFADTGERYLCRFTEPSMTLIVGKTANESDLRDSALDRTDDDVSTHDVDGAEIAVRDHVYPNGRAEHTAELLAPERSAFVAITLSLDGDKIPDDWSAADTATTLGNLVRS